MTDMALQENTVRSGSVRHTAAVFMLLILVLIAAAAMRLVGLDWDEGYHLHPDERFLSDVTSNLTPVSSIGEYFDTQSSTLNPNTVAGGKFGFYVYGNFPIILTRYISGWLKMDAYFYNYKVGRVLSATADLLTIAFLFLTGWEIFDRRVGLLAAALYAAMALPIQQSHFYTVDTFTTLFVTASTYFAARLVTRHRWIDYGLFGLMLGLAMSSKVSIFPFALVLILALVVRVVREIQATAETVPNEDRTINQRQPAIVRALLGLVLAGLVTVLTFRVGQPYAFLPPNSNVPYNTEQLGTVMTAISRIANPIGMRPNPSWLAQMSEVRRQVSGHVDMPPNHQWAHQPKIIFPWLNMVRIGMGWPLGLWCWFSFAWAMLEIARRRYAALHLLPLVVWIAVYFVWQGSGWVMSMRYFLPIYPTLALLGAWGLITGWDRVQFLLTERSAPRWHPAAKLVAALGALIVIGGFGWGFAVSQIYTQPMTRIDASRWAVENIPSDVTLHFEDSGESRTYEVGLPNDWPDHQLLDEQQEQVQPTAYLTRIEGGTSRSFLFQIPFNGTLTQIRFNHIVDPAETGDHRLLKIAISTTPDVGGTIGEATLIQPFPVGADPRGGAYLVDISPLTLTADQPYYLIIEPDSAGALVFAGSTVTTEGDWDDPVPLNIPRYNIWDAQFHPYTFQMAWEDEQPKRERLEYILNHTDYITISSNRFYGTLPRNPNRFPLSIEYYKALFSGELGFELVADFTARPTLGPFEFVDDTAEEAWTVYDHPRVLIFRKAPNYDPARTAEILDRADVSRIQKIIASQAGGRPLTLLPPDIGEQPLLPRSTGYDIEATVPSSDVPIDSFWTIVQPIAVIVWWLVIGVFGWAVMPMLYTLMPGLRDRGMGISRIFAMLLIAWFAWVLASLKLLEWSAISILFALVFVAMISLALVWPRRAEFVAWMRANRSHIIFSELALLVMFLFFLFVRLGNPDLWHLSFGGEKPMDLAYFNAVLNSRTFPPYDPWFAGGTINYYYFGFVIVGAPVKLLGMPTTLAYNLILPTMFAVTGFAAFCAAFNLLAHSEDSVAEPITDDTPVEPTLGEVLRAWPRVTTNEVFDAWGRTLRGRGGTGKTHRAYVAGIAAMLMAVLLGNLDQVRTIFWGLAELGAGQPMWTSTLMPRPEYLLQGFQMFMQGAQLPVGIGDWYWNATRLIPVPIVNNSPAEYGPITEFPYFTFLYADLHAHMMALSITMMVVVWSVSQIREASGSRQGGFSRIVWWLGNLFVGGLIIGALRPTNTWDWPTYLAIGAAALVIAQIVRRHDSAAYPAIGIGGVLALISGAVMYQSNRELIGQPDAAGSVIILAGVVALIGFLVGYILTLLVISMRRRTSEDTPQRSLFYSIVTLILAGIQAAVLAGLTSLLFLPYIENYQLGYTSAAPWLGSKTPIWAYLDIHGLFLFLIISWLVYETVLWVRSINRSSEGGRTSMLPLIISGILLIGSAVLISTQDVKIAILALPMLLWALALFLRPDQRPLKRLALVMLIVALSLSLVVELVVLQGDISRMNTVFKFYLQIWMLYAIVAGAAFGWVWPAILRSKSPLRFPWLTVFAVLVFLATLYPITATRAKVMDRWNPDAPHTLDGMAYMNYVDYSVFADAQQTSVVFPLSSDYAALRWLQENVDGAPVILEAQMLEYQWGGRIAIYTGFPSVVGWNWHQRQQRGWQAGEVQLRVDSVNLAYNTPDIQYTLAFLKTYNVDLIIVGELEHAKYLPEGIAKFEQMESLGYLRVIYEGEGTRIYEVIDNQLAGS